VIFLDEPTVGLDPRSARLMKDILRRLCDEGTTVFVSTHILEIAERMCDRFAIINKGRIVATGTMAELRAQAVTSSEGEERSLEDIFLELTGGSEHRDLIQFLG
jgi:ABC-2 type transport system ATP-binding protein